MLFVEFFLYLSSRFVGKFGGNGVREICVKEGLKEVKCYVKDVSDETSS